MLFQTSICRTSLLVLTLILAGCGRDDRDPPPEPPLTECEISGEEVIEFTSGKGLERKVLKDGDELQLVIGSQVGMEARVMVQTSGLLLSAVDHSEVSLEVEGYPIAAMSIFGEDCECEEARVLMDAPLLVDVVPHPTVRSVLQLSKREAQLVVKIYGAEGSLAETSTTVILLI